MSNEEFILLHLEDDVRSLALKKMPEGINVLWVLKQIEGYQLAKRKLPHWTEIKDVWYPPKLSMEQCSSQSTAEYKALLLKRLLQEGDNHLPLSLVDLTGGFGVDFSYMAKEVSKATYVEQQEELCDAARHNFPLFGLKDVNIVNDTCESFISGQTGKTEDAKVGAYFIDPARRDDSGKKVFFIEDCTPDLNALQDKMLQTAHFIIVKLSPMLDITQALRSLKSVVEVHVVSVKGECKELLLVMQSNAERKNISNLQSVVYHCVNLDTEDKEFKSTPSEDNIVKYATTALAGKYLYEPNASIQKAGLQDYFAAEYKLHKLHPQSNLFIGESLIERIPARGFIIKDMCDFSKSATKAMLKDVKHANLTIRNFPSTVAELRKRLKVKEGGGEYLFATTLADGKHALIRCEKPKKD